MNIRYLKRIFSAYLLCGSSNLSFWHTPLKTNNIDKSSTIGRYYMNFKDKTRYAGPFDKDGIPMLDYKGSLGCQYNPNAVAQYALGLYDLFVDTNNPEFKDKFLKQADWFINNIRITDDKTGLWEYNFPFEYHSDLKAPWRSALAQGQGISVLARAYILTENKTYKETAEKAFRSFEKEITEPAGVTFTDDDGYVWFEELIFNPPTHVLNGFIWALWGVYDYYLLTKNQNALLLFQKGVKTLKDNVYRYDIGFWTVYHLLPTRLKMVASPYYQRLHIVQMDAMYKLTKNEIFKIYHDKWQSYYSNVLYLWFAFCWKCLFKVFYY